MSQVEILSYLKPEMALCGQGQIEYLKKQPTVQQIHIPKAAWAWVRSGQDSPNVRTEIKTRDPQMNTPNSTHSCRS